MVLRDNPSLTLTLWTSETENSHICVGNSWKKVVLSADTVQLTPWNSGSR